MKKSIIKTFTVLIIIVLVDVLLFSITSGVSTASIMGETEQFLWNMDFSL